MSAVHVEPLTLQLDPARQFDFWLGEWDCAWEDGDRRHVATNSVYLDLDGKVVVESFDGRPAIDFQGLSFSVYDRKAALLEADLGRQRRQLPRLHRPLRGRRDGAAPDRRGRRRPGVFRMRWENIERDSLDWSWQRSDDGGETWTSLWEIEYRRVL